MQIAQKFDKNLLGSNNRFMKKYQYSYLQQHLNLDLKIQLKQYRKRTGYYMPVIYEQILRWHGFGSYGQFQNAMREQQRVVKHYWNTLVKNWLERSS